MDYTPKSHNSECGEAESDDDDVLPIFGKSCKDKSRASWIRRSCAKARISFEHNKRSIDSFSEGTLSAPSPISISRSEDKYTTPVNRHKTSRPQRSKRRSNISREMFLSIGCRDKDQEVLGDTDMIQRDAEDVLSIVDPTNESALDLSIEKIIMGRSSSSSKHSESDVLDSASGLPEYSMNSHGGLVDQPKEKKSAAYFSTPIRKRQTESSKTPLSVGKLNAVVSKSRPMTVRQGCCEEDNHLVKTGKKSIKAFKTPFLEFVEDAKDDKESQAYSLCESERATPASFVSNVSASLKDEKEVKEDDATTPISEYRESARCLENSVLFVDFRTGNENRGDVLRKVALELGAQVVDKFGPSVSHVIFKDGSKANYKRAKRAGIPILSASWLEESKKRGKKMLESDFPSVSVELYDTPEVLKKRKKFKSMQPKSLDEEFQSVSKAHLRKAKLSERKAMRQQEAGKLRVQVLDNYPPHEHYYKGSQYDIESVKINRLSESSLHGVLRACAAIDEDVSNTNEVFGGVLESFSPENDYDIPLAEKLVKKYQSPSIQDTKHSISNSSVRKTKLSMCSNFDDVDSSYLQYVTDVTTPSGSNKTQTEVVMGQSGPHIIQRLSLTPSFGDNPDSDERMEDGWPDALRSNDLLLDSKVRPKKFINPFKHSPSPVNRKRKFDSAIQNDDSVIPMKRIHL